jgi:hypothetical protein
MHGSSHPGSLLGRGKIWNDAKNVLFCLKNIGLAKEPDHTPALFRKQNDIAEECENHSGEMLLSLPRVVVEA